MKKRRHHYVWRRYLRSWAKNDLIWCLRNGNVFETNLINIGQARDFYKLKELTEQEISFIKKVALEKNNPILRELNQGWIELFTLVFKLKKVVEKKKIIDPKLNKIIDEAIFNLEEDLHGRLESQAEPYLDAILQEDISFYRMEDGFIDFTHYICVQYMRTQNIKNNVQLSLRGFDVVDIDKIWNILTHIFATNLGWSIYADKKPFNMILLKNDTQLELITGDQPVINTYAIGIPIYISPADLEFYYPVSPCLAILLSNNDSYAPGEMHYLSLKDVKKYNQGILEQSHSQIYSKSKEILNEYI